MRRNRWTLAILAFVVVVMVGTTGDATMCTSGTGNDHQCWTPLSGPNYSQVALGYTASGVGIACAVQSPQGASWGAFVDCYRPFGTSGASLEGRTGAYVPGSPFDASNPSARIVSLTITNSLAHSNAIWVYALRSDGQIFAAVKDPWPPAPGADPTFPFTFVASPPCGARSCVQFRSIAAIQWASPPGQFTHLYAVGTNSYVYVRDGSAPSGWSVPAGPDALLVGGLGTRGLLLSGGNADSTTLASIISTGGTSPPKLPQSVLRLWPSADPNVAFNTLGFATPIAASYDGAYALVPCAAASATPCILRSTLSGGSWSPWTSYVTGDLETPDKQAPWTIQDGRQFRGVDGEVWVINSNFHLSFWAP